MWISSLKQAFNNIIKQSADGKVRNRKRFSQILLILELFLFKKLRDSCRTQFQISR